MKLWKAAIAAASIGVFASSLSGCNTIGITPSANVRLDAVKALGLAWTALDGAALSVEAYRNAGGFNGHGLQEARCAQLLAQARDMLKAADDAYHADQANNPALALSKVADLIAQVRTITGH